MAQILDVQNLNVTYVNKKKRVHAVRNASFQLREGESVGIVGESGSGKSTLAMAILGLLPKKSTEITGKAIFDGQKDLLTISEQEMNALRWKDIAIVFQKAMNSLSPVHRIRTLVEDIYRVHESKADSEEIREVMLRLLKMVGLPERVYELYPHEMSGGMLQRVSIAISMLHQPRLLVFDEATTALDVVTQGQILEEVLELEKALHTTRIMITHDMSVVATSCSHIAVMYAGEMLEQGQVSEVMVKPEHPYTQALLKSFPSLKGKNSRLESIPGHLPDLSKPNPACAFCTRCTFAGPRCAKEKPKLMDLGSGHCSACFLTDGGVK